MTVCEMCGKDSNLTKADVEGVEMGLCPNCVKYGTVKRRVFNQRFTKQKSLGDIPQFKIINNYAALLKSVREGKGMNQEDFAKFLNEKESIVAKWESGRLRPRIDIARRLERVLKISLVEGDVRKAYQPEKVKKSDVFTLGDFIKVRKNKK